MKNILIEMNIDKSHYDCLNRNDESSSSLFLKQNRAVGSKPKTYIWKICGTMNRLIRTHKYTNIQCTIIHTHTHTLSSDHAFSASMVLTNEKESNNNSSKTNQIDIYRKYCSISREIEMNIGWPAA